MQILLLQCRANANLTYPIQSQCKSYSLVLTLNANLTTLSVGWTVTYDQMVVADDVLLVTDTVVFIPPQIGLEKQVLLSFVQLRADYKTARIANILK